MGEVLDSVLLFKLRKQQLDSHMSLSQHLHISRKVHQLFPTQKVHAKMEFLGKTNKQTNSPL